MVRSRSSFLAANAIRPLTISLHTSGMELLSLELVVRLVLIATAYVAASALESRAKRKREEKPAQPQPNAATGSRTQFGQRPPFKE